MVVYTALGFLKPSLESHSQVPSLKLFWKVGEVRRELKSWNIQEFQALSLKRKKSRERNPQEGKFIEWNGILLTHLLEEAWTSLSLDEKAFIDWIVLVDDQGKSVSVPRALAIKYPIFLADRWSDASQEERGNWVCVIPWTSHPKILKEEIFLEKYFLSRVASIEFTSYQDRFSEYLLRKRTDPTSMHGERLFVANCLSCHAGANRLSSHWSLDFFQQKHASVFSSLEKREARVLPSISWDGKHWKMLERYWEAYALENASSQAAWRQRANL
jgi:hypothetical protein